MTESAQALGSKVYHNTNQQSQQFVLGVSLLFCISLCVSALSLKGELCDSQCGGGSGAALALGTG